MGKTRSCFGSMTAVAGVQRKLVHVERGRSAVVPDNWLGCGAAQVRIEGCRGRIDLRHGRPADTCRWSHLRQAAEEQPGSKQAGSKSQSRGLTAKCGWQIGQFMRSVLISFHVPLRCVCLKPESARIPIEVESRQNSSLDYEASDQVSQIKPDIGFHAAEGTNSSPAVVSENNRQEQVSSVESRFAQFERMPNCSRQFRQAEQTKPLTSRLNWNIPDWFPPRL